MERLKDEGLVKWAVLGVCIATLEFVGEESLTHAFERARAHPVGRVVAIGGLAITASHLMGKIPRRIDPFYVIQDNLKNVGTKWVQNES